MANTQIIKADFNNPLHRDAVFNLMNHYMTDKMGGCDPHPLDKKDALINGLKETPTAIVLLAVCDDRFVGLMNSFVNFATFTVKKFINVHDIVVLNSHRGKGIGKLLFDKLFEIAKKLDCSKVTLEVREDNQTAQHLYKRLGFEDCNPPMYFWAKYF